jgi:hypothetical protein
MHHDRFEQAAKIQEICKWNLRSSSQSCTIIQRRRSGSLAAHLTVKQQSWVRIKPLFKKQRKKLLACGKNIKKSQIL